MHIVELWEYPIKSCQGNLLTQADVSPEGFVNDRRYQWVTEKGVFLSQRNHPKLGYIKAQKRGNLLTIILDQQEWLVNPADFVTEVEATIWNDRVDSIGYEGDLNDVVSELLGLKVRLVYLPDKGRIISDASAEGHVSFADGLPYLLTTTASLKSLNEQLASAVTMQRFRPNLVVANKRPFEEDRWSRFRIGPVIFRSVKPCGRCVMTTINPETATPSADAEPLKTLSTFRKQDDGQITFGVNLIAENGGRIETGMPLERLD